MTKQEGETQQSSTVQSVLEEKRVVEYLDGLSCGELFGAAHQLWHYINWWGIIPSKSFLTQIELDAPVLLNVIPFATLLQRLEALNPGKDGPVSPAIGDIMPELPRVLRLIYERIECLPPSVEKAESWLKPIALDAGADANVEAAIYFASRGRKVLPDGNHLHDAWHDAICRDIESGRTTRTAPEEIIERARDRSLSLAEAAGFLESDNPSLPRFFSFRDEEEDFIDAAMFRAVEWLGIIGFDPWLRAMAKELSLGPQGGIEHCLAGWALFNWSRSDLALRMIDRGAWETWLYTLCNGPVERSKPWRERKHNGSGQSDYVPLAAIICFLWHRVRPVSVKDDVLRDALELIMGTQMRSGAWPLRSDDSRPCLLATCAAIHGLALDRPAGWKSIAGRAADWLMTVQSPGGFWDIDGGPTVMLTVLALDSLELATGGTQVTFQVGRSDGQQGASNLNAVEEPTYDYTGMEWHNPRLPALASRSAEETRSGISTKIALAVATDVELRQVLRLMRPADGENEIVQVHDGTHTYYVGLFGAFPAVLTMSSMGAQGVTGSTLTVNALIQAWSPTVVIATGIAFGRSREKQRPGDVLVADRIINYESQRMGESQVNRGHIPPCSAALVDRFRNALGWRFDRPDATPCAPHVGPVLSGEKLVAQEEFKRALLDDYPDAIGGEMEGTGLWSAAEAEHKQWILVKGVCDWGDELKVNDYQEMAAAAAVSLCHHVFNDAHALDGL